MPIFIKESQKDPASAGSSASESTRLKQTLVMLHRQVKEMTASLRKLRSEKRTLEQQLTQKDYDLRQLKQELQQLKKGSKNVGSVEFGD